MGTNMIEIKAVINCLGHLYLEPSKDIDKDIVAKSNRYDGTYNVYIRDSQDINIFLVDLPTVQRDSVINGWVQLIQMDYWTYRHMVGGQSD